LAKTVRPGELPSADVQLAAITTAVLIIDPEGVIAQVNAAAEALLNTSERHLVGLRFTDVVIMPFTFDAPRVEQFTAYDLDVTVLKGARLRLDISASVLVGWPGWGIVTLHGGSLNQLSERTRAPRNPRAAITMAAMLAHEIKNPLSGIRGAAQLLGREAESESAPELTQLICNEVDRIAGLIDQMQGFTDTRPLASTAQNIYPILDHVRTLAVNGFARGVDMRDDFDPSLPPVLVHRDALTQILLNLIKNAAEAIDPRTGRIWLSTAYRHGVSIATIGSSLRQHLPIEVCVIDNGPGPPKDVIDNLFQPFISSKSSGRGLGLALADKLMRDMGGLIQFTREGNPERTVFRLLLPRAGGKK